MKMKHLKFNGSPLLKHVRTCGRTVEMEDYIVVSNMRMINCSYHVNILIDGHDVLLTIAALLMMTAR